MPTAMRATMMGAMRAAMMGASGALYGRRTQHAASLRIARIACVDTHCGPSQLTDDISNGTLMINTIPPDLGITEHESLARHTSWRVGGPARYYAEPKDIQTLRALLAWADAQAIAVFMLGGGTNVLARDAGFDGLVIRYVARDWQIEAAEHDAYALVQAAAGVTMAGLARRLCAMGWGGLEWAEGLPGTVGGAVFGNAGCYGGDVASILHSATILDNGQSEEWSPARLAYGYRTSALKALAKQSTGRAPLVLEARFALQRADPAELAAFTARTAAERKARTPWGNSCGSVFKNPPGASAGRLIEAAGLKGHQVGDAIISERHANYIVNLGAASAADILALIAIAREHVHQHSGQHLELEVQVL